MDGKYGYAKTSEVDFSRGKLAIKSYFRVGGGGGGVGFYYIASFPMEKSTTEIS